MMARALSLNSDRKKVVIVGGGTAGLVIANNLQNHFDVIVIEKSDYVKYPIRYRVPLLIGILFRKKGLKYLSKRSQVSDDGRHIPWFESNVLGGASVINGCVHMFGSKLRWSYITKKFNIEYDELIKSYENIFSLKTRKKNKINLSLAYQSTIDNEFIRTLNFLGIPKSDTNYSDKEGCGEIYNTVGLFFRTSVMSLIKKFGFKCHTSEHVKRLIFNDYNVVGVETNRRKIKSDYVILSGGVVGTCDLLLREKSRHKNNNNFIFNNLSFGENIQDHTNLRVNVSANKSIGSLNEISDSFFQKLALISKHYIGVSTVMKGTGATSAVHLDLDRDGEIDTRIQVVQFSETGRHGSDGEFFSNHNPGFSLSITAINPKSKGSIKIDGESNSINPKFLSDKGDVELLKLALEFCIKLLKSKPLSEHVLDIENEYDILTNPERYIRDNVFSSHHLIGGTHDAINSNFELKSVEGVYVCDASIFDTYTASNIHSSVVLMADIFSKKFINHNI